MTLDTLLALFGFAFVTVMTPGPNNLMLMASGANFGMRRTLPHMAGIVIGFPAMVMLVGLGVAQLLDRIPGAMTLLQAGCAAFLLYMAWKIATATPGSADRARSRPLRFAEAAAFQWVNPKAWSMALAAVTLHAGGGEGDAVMIVAAAFVATSLISTTSWTLMGRGLQGWLGAGRRLRVFNLTLSALLLASLVPVLRL